MCGTVYARAVSMLSYALLGEKRYFTVSVFTQRRPLFFFI